MVLVLINSADKKFKTRTNEMCKNIALMKIRRGFDWVRIPRWCSDTRSRL